MPLPKPKPKEDKSSFMERCLSNPTMNEEYPDKDQRYAVCQSTWEEKALYAAIAKMLGKN